MQVLLNRENDTLPLPSRATRGSLGHDLSVSETVVIRNHETVVAPTGLKLATSMPYALDAIAPSGLGMFILPRSSLILKYGLVVGNSPGLVDPDYTDEIRIILHKIPVEGIPDEITLEAGTRVAQAVFINCYFPWINFTECVDSSRTNRSGFGSTGE